MTDTALATRPDAHLTSGQIFAGLNTVASVLAPDLSPEELRLFAMVASRSGLDPFAKQIYAVKRKGRVTFQTGIDGYRSIAARTGLYNGQDEPEYGAACTCGEPRPAGHPEYATVRVYRKGVDRAIAATAYWHEYKPESGQSGLQDAMWVRMPRVMIAKVAEALALRKAFPYDPENRQGIGADVYTADEMSQAERTPPVVAKPDLRERLAARVEAVQDITEAEFTEPDEPARPAAAVDSSPERPAETPAPTKTPATEAPEEAAKRQEAAGGTGEPPAAALSNGPCGNASPYGDGAACGLPGGHGGLHRELSSEGVVVASWKVPT